MITSCRKVTLAIYGLYKSFGLCFTFPRNMHKTFYSFSYMEHWQFRMYTYRISSYSFRGNYSFLTLALCTVTFDLSTWMCGNYSREDYSRAKTIWGNTVSCETHRGKVKILWEGHFGKKISQFFLTSLSKVKYDWDIFSNFVAF